MCRAAGVCPPEFAEVGPSSVVTFRVNVAGTVATTAQVTGQVTGQVALAVLDLCRQPRTAKEIQATAGIKHRETFLNNYLNPLLGTGWIERTIPDTPNSRLQKYRLTETGMRILENPK